MENVSRERKKVLIVGGVAGGANVAARLRRLDENCEITIFERGSYVSFANCGLPYHIGGEIEKREKLLVHTPKSLESRFGITVKVRNEVLSIDRGKKEVLVKNLDTGETYSQSYDNLVLSPGAVPLRPPIPGLDLPGIFTLRDIRDMDNIINYFKESSPKNLLVVGGGFIGLEMVEQLHRNAVGKDIKIRLLELNDHVLPPLDSEMVKPIEDELVKNGIDLSLKESVVGFSTVDGAVMAETSRGNKYSADFVLLCIGVRPETKLASSADLKLGQRGGISVDSKLRTSDSAIYALGDCIETSNFITGEYGVVPLAGPANRQGRIVADNICGLDSEYKGTLGTAIVRAFGTTAATVGVNEKTLKRLSIPYKKIYLHPASHASYYPGAKSIHLKLLYSPDSGKILGAQAVGEDGVDKRIDVISTAIYSGLSVDELIDLELCYAPPFGSAKDPVNLSGMIAQNVMNELVETLDPSELSLVADSSTILDVREDIERSGGFIPNSLHIPLGELRQRLSEVPKDKLVVTYCQSGQRSYMACRILLQHGIRCKNLNGAYKTWVAAT